MVDLFLVMVAGIALCIAQTGKGSTRGWRCMAPENAAAWEKRVDKIERNMPERVIFCGWAELVLAFADSRQEG
jgi:hypothetical protein